MRHIMQLIVIGLFTHIITGCSTTLPASAAPQNLPQSWPTRAAALTRLSAWDLEGMIAIQQAGHNVTANWRWHQAQKKYSFYFSGPMGINGMQLSGDARQVILQNPQGRVFSAAAPEQLLAAQTGWRLPVTNLLYWVRGLPTPSTPYRQTLDAYQHLQQLTQAGWQIQYLRYTAVDCLDLPAKIFLQSQDFRVKILISRWQLGK